MKLPPMFRALGHRNYRLYWTGHTASLVGTWMQTTAQMWLVYRLTGSSFMLGLTGFVSQIPMLVLGLVGGATADRFPRKRILFVTQSISGLQALVLGALTLSGTVEVWHILALAGLLGCVNAFDMPARQSFLSETVDRGNLGNAIALNSFSINASRMVGPALAGVLVAAWGEGISFLANGFSFCALLYSLYLIRVPGRVPDRSDPGGHLARIRAGLAYVVSRPRIGRPLLVTALIAIAGMPYAVLMPVFAREVLGGGPRALGLLMGSVGAGAVAGALVLARRDHIRGMVRTVGRAIIGFGAGLVLFSLSRSFPLSILILFLAGFAMVTTLAGTNTLLQSLTSDAMRGRVMSLRGMMFIGMTPIGNLILGSFAQRFGAPAAVTVGGTVCALAGMFFLLSTRPKKAADRRPSRGTGRYEA